MGDLKKEHFIIIKDNRIVLTATITLAILVLIISLAVTRSFYSSLLIVFIYLLVSVSLVILLRKTYIFSEKGITIANKLGSTQIRWDEVLSMSLTLIDDEEPPCYQIKTKAKTFSIYDLARFEKIKDYVANKANLELEAESSAWFNYPPLQRWKKKNEDYVYTSLHDRYSNWHYNISSKNARIIVSAILVISIIVVFIFIINFVGNIISWM